MRARLVGTLTYPLLCGGAVALASVLLARGLAPFWVTGALSVAAGLTVAGLERLAPNRRDWLFSHGDLTADGFHLAASAALVWWAEILGRRMPAGPLHLWPAAWPIAAQVLLALVIRDFGAYWCHRALHGWSWLWRFHEIHHSSERLYWLNSTRNHPVDVLAVTLSTLGPLALLGAPAPVLVLLNAYVSVHLLLQHSNVALRLGPANWLLNSAEVHRWHHSLDTEESLNNFSHVLLLWDWVFGTARRRTHQGPPVVGLSGPDVPPLHYPGQILFPFRRRDWISS